MSNKIDIEFRIRTKDNKDTEWLEIPSIVYPVEKESIRTYCEIILQAHPDITEVRWNYPDSLNGHYVRTCILQTKKE